MFPSEHQKLGYTSTEQAGCPAPPYVSEYPTSFPRIFFWMEQGTLCQHRAEAGSAGLGSGASNHPPMQADTSGKAPHEFFMKLDY